MNKGQNQMEMPDIDNTPLAEALTRAAKMKEKIIILEKGLEEQKNQVLVEMRNVDRRTITHAGFCFSIKQTEARTKIDIKRSKT